MRHQWLGTTGWLALLPVRVEGPGQEELTQSQGIFQNHAAAFPNLHTREGQIAFSIGTLTPEIVEALRATVADSEDQAGHVREARARRNRTHRAFAADFHPRFGPLPSD